MQVKPLVFAKGLATFLPGALRFACGRSYGSDSPRYCYSVWLRHLVILASHGIDTNFATVAELGPGDSLGIGLAAILTGASRYFAFDAVPHARTQSNIEMLDALVRLFDAREPIPGSDEFPEISPAVDSQSFPSELLEPRLTRGATVERIEGIRRALNGDTGGHITIRYAAPWHDSALVESDGVDLVFSQAVLEHVDDVDATYRALFRWLRPGGIMSHAIDFKSHGLTRDWFGHWTIPAWQWRLVRGRRPYLINRLPASAHIDRMRAAGFEVLYQLPLEAVPAPRTRLALEFQGQSDADLRTAGVFVIGRKS